MRDIYLVPYKVSKHALAAQGLGVGGLDSTNCNTIVIHPSQDGIDRLMKMINERDSTVVPRITLISDKIVAFEMVQNYGPKVYTDIFTMNFRENKRYKCATGCCRPLNGFFIINSIKVANDKYGKTLVYTIAAEV